MAQVKEGLMSVAINKDAKLENGRLSMTHCAFYKLFLILNVYFDECGMLPE